MIPANIGKPLGTRMIEGLLAEGRRMTMMYPAGMMDNNQPMVGTNEYWTSVDLKITLVNRSSDPRGGESLRALINIDRIEPAPRLLAASVVRLTHFPAAADETLPPPASSYMRHDHGMGWYSEG